MKDSTSINSNEQLLSVVEKVPTGNQSDKFNYSGLTEIYKKEHQLYNSYVKRLSSDEKRIFNANSSELQLLSRCSSDSVKYFVSISQLCNSLEVTHSQYNFLVELSDAKAVDQSKLSEYVSKYCTLPEEANLEEIASKLFSCHISIGQHSEVMQLFIMNECNQLYNFLSRIKQIRFDYLIDTVDVSELISILDSK